STSASCTASPLASRPPCPSPTSRARVGSGATRSASTGRPGEPLPRRALVTSPRMRRSAARWLAPLLAAPLLLAGCGDDVSKETAPRAPGPVAPSAATSPAAPAEPLPALRTGILAPEEHAGLLATLAAYHVEGEAEYLELRAPIVGDDLSLEWDRL